MKRVYRVALWLLFFGVGCAALPTSIAPSPVPRSTPLVVTPPPIKPNLAVTLASGQIKTWDVSADETDVYWTDCGDNPDARNGRVLRAAKAGGAPVALAANERCPQAIALDATHVYWLAGDSQFITHKIIRRVAKTGGASETISPAQDIRSFAVDDANVYWTLCDLQRNAGALNTMPKTGGAPVALAAGKGCFFDLALDATHAYWIEERGVMRAAKAGGAPQTLAPAQFHPRALLADATNLYWLADQYVMRLGKTDAAPSVLFAGQESFATLAQDATHLFWVDARGTILKMAKTGGAPVALVEMPGKNFYALATDAQNVYWTNLAGGVLRAEKTGGAPVVLDPNLPQPLVVAQEGLNSFTLDATSVYWTRCRYEPEKHTHGSVYRIAQTGGTPVLLAADQACPKNIAADAAEVYWINEGAETSPGEYRNGAVMRVAKTGGAPQTLAAKQDGHANLAVDDAFVYWTDCGTGARNFQDGAVLKMAKAGGVPQTLANAQKCPGSVAADAANVYWQSGGKIFRADKATGALATFVETGGNAITLDETHVYWTRTESASRTTYRSCADERSVLLRAAKTGGASQPLAQIAGFAPTQIALDATSVYYATDCTEGILRVAKTGGEARVSVPRQNANGLAVNATRLYWSVSAQGLLLHRAK